MASTGTPISDPDVGSRHVPPADVSWLRRITPAALWLLPCLAVTAGFELTRPESVPTPPWWRFLLFQAAIWLPWAGITPMVSRLRRRFPLADPPPRALLHIGLHAATAIGVAFALTAALTAIEYIVARQPLDPAHLAHLILIAGHAMLLLHVLIYGTLLSGFEIAAFRQRLRDRETQLQRARLDALQHQLQPHFLFNTLHAVSNLIDEDTVSAQAMVARLSDLLRASLSEDDPLVPLRRELEIADAYLAIEEVRYGSRLQVQRQIDEDTLDVPVPPLLLQPVLENAVRFSVGRRRGPCHLEITARHHGDVLCIDVRDDGIGLPAGAEGVLESSRPGHGVGLDNTRARLRTLYGEHASLELRDRSDGAGAEVHISLPDGRNAERNPQA